MVDMEGLTGIDEAALTKAGSPGWLSHGREFATGDVIAAVEGASDAGADQVLVRDFHQSGCNVLTERLPAGATYLGGEPLGAGRVPVFGVCDASFDALVMVGLHPMAGAQGFMPHTLNSTVAALGINGRPIGEIALFAGVAGHFGFPLVAVAGDAGAAQETAMLNLCIETAITKSGSPAVSLVAPDVARAEIRAAARAGVSKAIAGRIAPVVFDTPVTMKYTPSRNASDLLVQIPRRVAGVTKTGSGTSLTWTGSDFLDAFVTLFHVHQRSGDHGRKQL